MVRLPTAPCDDALKAMPGDIITFETDEGVITGPGGIVKTAGWQPSPNGGKIWTYETMSGVMVPNTQVIRVEKRSGTYVESIFQQDKPPGIKLRSHDKMMEEGLTDQFGNELSEINDEIRLQQELMHIADRLNLSPTYKVVMACILANDLENVEVAVGLLRIRARQLKELAAASYPAFGPIQNNQNPLKEEKS